jgi:hypothetical protein
MPLLIFWLSVLTQLAHTRFASAGHYLPDPDATPGVIRPLSTEQICRIKWGKDERHVTPKMKREVCAAYGESAADCPGKKFEIDHLVSRELGGADEVKNLWPEPEPDAHVKDVVENRLHKQVCAGQMSLADAQKLLRTDWTEALR